MPSIWATLAAQHDGKDRWYLEALGIGADKNWEACFDAWVKRMGGKLDSQDMAVGELLPADQSSFFVAGDVRSNENVGLTSMHTLWLREHNRLADELAETEFAGQNLSDADVDEEIYQRARQMVIGLIQHITYNEFLPSTLGFNALGPYKGYDASVNPQISNEFATAVYRIGHTTLPNELQM